MGEHIDQKQRWPTSNRDLLTATATAVPVWNFYGFAVRFFHDTWGEVALPVVPVSYGLNAGFVVLLPFPAARRTDHASGCRRPGRADGRLVSGRDALFAAVEAALHRRSHPTGGGHSNPGQPGRQGAGRRSVRAAPATSSVYPCADEPRDVPPAAARATEPRELMLRPRSIQALHP
jgi:hypothetical protein